jgi:hypothetical protein
MFLGGVRSAGWESSSAGFGPLRSSAFSRFATASSTEARVFIHDFDAMDEELLNRSVSQSSATAGRLGAHAEDAWLFAERRRVVAPRAAPVAGGETIARSERQQPVEAGLGPPPTGDPSRLAEFYLSRGRAAESFGKTGAAALCYRMAVKYGCRDAEERLAALK